MRRIMVVLAIFAVLLPGVVSAQDLDREIKLGQEADQQFCKEAKLVTDPAVLSRVSAIGRRLAKVSERPKINYTFRVYQSIEPNAAALPGGYVYVSSAMLEACASDDELAAIMAHEIAHSSLGHGLQQYDKARKAKNNARFWDVIGGLIFHQEFTLVGKGEPGVGTVVAGLKLLSYSRQQEAEADSHILPYMKAAGFQPIGAVGIFQWLKRLEEALKKQGSDPEIGWLSTHPDTEGRYQKIYDEVARPILAQAELQYGLPIAQAELNIVSDEQLANQLINELQAQKSPLQVAIADSLPIQQAAGTFNRKREFWLHLTEENGFLWGMLFENDPIAGKLASRKSIQASSMSELGQIVSRQITARQAEYGFGLITRAKLLSGSEYEIDGTTRGGESQLRDIPFYIMRPQVGRVGKGLFTLQCTIKLLDGELQAGDLLVTNPSG